MQQRDSLVVFLRGAGVPTLLLAHRGGVVGVLVQRVGARRAGAELVEDALDRRLRHRRDEVGAQVPPVRVLLLVVVVVPVVDARWRCGRRCARRLRL